MTNMSSYFIWSEHYYLTILTQHFFEDMHIGTKQGEASLTVTAKSLRRRHFYFDAVIRHHHYLKPLTHHGWFAKLHVYSKKVRTCSEQFVLRISFFNFPKSFWNLLQGNAAESSFVFNSSGDPLKLFEINCKVGSFYSYKLFFVREENTYF